MVLNFMSFSNHGALSVIQIAAFEPDSFEYISGSNAIKQNFVEAVEIDNSGRVNDINIVNHSNHFIFFSDGDVIIGSKQNRTFNSSVLLAPNSNTKIPVSCVESGRWNYKSQKFDSSDFVLTSKMRAHKSEDVFSNLKASKAFYADQGNVWDDVSELSTLFKISSPTSDLTDVYKNKVSDIDDFIKHFQHNDQSNGIAVFFNDKLLNVEVFNRYDIFKEYFPKLIRAAALDAVYYKADNTEFSHSEAELKLQNFLDSYESFKLQSFPGIGVGIEKRFEDEKIVGHTLYYDEKMIHFSALHLSERNHDRRHNDSLF